MYCDLRDHNSVFSGLIATDWAQVGVQWHNQPELADAELVFRQLFRRSGRAKLRWARLVVPSDDIAQEASPVWCWPSIIGSGDLALIRAL